MRPENTLFLVNKVALKKSVASSKTRRGGGSSCQDSIDEQIDGGKHWITLTKLLQNVKGKGIATLVAKIPDREVVVKVQEIVAARKELEVFEALAHRKLGGFLRPFCFFTCDGARGGSEGTREYVESLTEGYGLCGAKGTAMGVIVMPHYSKGSFEDYLKEKGRNDVKTVKMIASVVVSTVFDAFNAAGFVHGDLFPKNILIGDGMVPVLTDFELAEFFWIDLGGFFDSLIKYGYTEFDEFQRKHVLMNRAYGRSPDATMRDSIIADLKI